MQNQIAAFYAAHTGGMDAFEQRVEKLLSSIKGAVGAEFTGIGLIFYSPPLNLPARSLGDPALFVPRLPISGDAAIAGLLAGISRSDSPWHDGFHLIDAASFQLTHVCQFLSPPLDLIGEPEKGNLPVGARWYSALAISKLPQVILTALIGQQGTQVIFRQGRP